jgi:6,7-dimethyl-8-ribityllumazine synthase
LASCHTKNLPHLAASEPLEIFQNFGASRENPENTLRRALKIGSPRFMRVAGALEYRGGVTVIDLYWEPFVLANILEGQLGPIEGRIAIVVSRYNHSITQRLLDGALSTLEKNKVSEEQVDVAWVPGAWELPVAAQRFAESDEYRAVICLGAVIKGETSHDEHINRQVAESLGQLALDNDLPIAFGLLTCGTLEQALNRAGGTVGNKGEEATLAALEMVSLLERLPALE